MTISDKVMLMGESDAPKFDTGMIEGHPSSALITALDSARDYATASRSDATWRAYRHDWQRFATAGASPSVNQLCLPAPARSARFLPPRPMLD